MWWSGRRLLAESSWHVSWGSAAGSWSSGECLRQARGGAPMASGALRPRGLKSPVVGQVQVGRCLAAGVLLSPMQWLWPCVTRGTRRGPVLAGSVWSLVSNAQAGKGKVKEAAWEDPAGPLRGKGLGPPGSLRVGLGCGSRPTWLGSGLCPTLPALGGSTGAPCAVREFRPHFRTGRAAAAPFQPVLPGSGRWYVARGRVWGHVCTHCAGREAVWPAYAQEPVFIAPPEWSTRAWLLSLRW